MTTSAWSCRCAFDAARGASLKIQALVVAGVRNLRPLSLEPRERFNVFSGDNGQGKTNLLEAIFVIYAVLHRSMPCCIDLCRAASIYAVLHRSMPYCIDLRVLHRSAPYCIDLRGAASISGWPSICAALHGVGCSREEYCGR
jgi:hypothetical protein